MCNLPYRSAGATECLMRDCHFEQPETLKDEIVFQVRILRDIEKKRMDVALGRLLTNFEVETAADCYLMLTRQVCAAEAHLDTLLAKLDEVSR